MEIVSSPVSGIVFSQLKATISGKIKCLPDSSAECLNGDVTLHAVDASGRNTGQNFVTKAKGKTE